MSANRVRFEHADPILRVEDMTAAVHYYVEVLGFTEAEWGDQDFSFVNRDTAGIYLCRGGQGHVGAWVWVGVADARGLHAELQAKGAKIRKGPTNYPWALEIHVEDVDGNVLRLGSEPEQDQPFAV